MGIDLVNWVSDQIARSGLGEEPGIVVLAAMEGDRQLDDYLGTGASTARARLSDRADSVGEPGGTFLSSITVEGFRGIGPAARLELRPTPGLTIVAGRNGSGKSSFSEALELALTGDTYRWKKRSVQWKEQWRNLHHPIARIVVGLVEEGNGPVQVTTTWAAGEPDAGRRTTKTQRQGGKQLVGLAHLGWERPLEQFRPILSYDELGGMLEGRPSELHDAIASVLGVEQIADALKRIQVRHKQCKAPGTALTQQRKTLLVSANGLPDERAVEAASLLKKTAPNMAALRALATGSTTVERGPVPALRTLANLTAPATPDQAAALAERLRDGVAEVADAATDVSARRLARLELLEQALAVHVAHGDMSCPVCRSGQLDAAWAASNRELAEAERREFASLDLARQTLRSALNAAHHVLTAPPAVLDRAPLPELESLVSAARAAWTAWAAAPRGSDAAVANDLADHIELHVDDLAAQVEQLRTTAVEQLTALDDKWQPLATQIGAWCNEWEAWLRQKPTVEVLATAEKWLKDNDLRLKNELLAPIRDGARNAWSKLRQESNVEIGNLSLEGSTTQRRVRIESSVDGTEARSLAVLSQGELHALALALFLPRAAMAESPFRFLVLDDPVQAMDPAKVDGLVELLSELARTRQVVVLSHDDRLPAAVRRANVGATILEVTRGKASNVSITTSTDPATRYLEDAFGLVKEWEEDRLSDVAMRRTLPGLLRFAVEASAKDRFFSYGLKQGESLHDVESAWDAAATTREKVVLAVFGEPRPNHELDRWASVPYRKFGLRNVGAAMHKGLKADLDPRDASRDVQRLVKDIAGGKP